MKIILSGGGTSGHVHPAIAIAEAIKAKRENCEFLFIGRENGFENRTITNENYELKCIRIEGIKREFSLKNIQRIKLALKAKEEAKKIIKSFSPNVVIGTGGYVCWPVITAAKELNIPTVIHESNVYPGLVTKLLSKKCDTVMLNHAETAKYLPKKTNCVVIGNPLRNDFNKISREKAREELKLKKDDILMLSFGGSGGSEKLNETIINVMNDNDAYAKNVTHIHATGNKYYKQFSKKINSKKSNRKILPYIDDMPKMLKASDIVITRSGAMTLSEISHVGLASILIPSPNVTNDHQYKNAKYFDNAEACILIEEKNLTNDLLKEKINLLIRDKQLRNKLAQNAKKITKTDAATAAAEIIFKLEV